MSQIKKITCESLCMSGDCKREKNGSVACFEISLQLHVTLRFLINYTSFNSFIMKA
jgi:hypothetical protein